MRRSRICAVVEVAAALALPAAAAAPAPGAVWAVDLRSGRTVARRGDRALAARAFPPGSLVKPFTALAALESGAWDAASVRVCASSAPSRPVFESCWYRRGHGPLSLEQAVGVSCDRYFRAVAEALDTAVFRDVLARFGLLDGGSFAPASRREAVESMVGTGRALRATPEALFSACCALAADGRLRSVSPDGLRFPPGRSVVFDAAAAGPVLRGMALAGAGGTGSPAQAGTGGMPFAGKTGTAPWLSDGRADPSRTHGWFVGFFPDGGAPTLAVLVFMLDGTGREAAGIGGAIAAEVAKDDPGLLRALPGGGAGRPGR